MPPVWLDRVSAARVWDDGAARRGGTAAAGRPRSRGRATPRRRRSSNSPGSTVRPRRCISRKCSFPHRDWSCTLRTGRRRRSSDRRRLCSRRRGGRHRRGGDSGGRRLCSVFGCRFRDGPGRHGLLRFRSISVGLLRGEKRADAQNDDRDDRDFHDASSLRSILRERQPRRRHLAATRDPYRRASSKKKTSGCFSQRAGFLCFDW